MKRRLLAWRRLRGGELRGARLAALVLLGVLGVLGVRAVFRGASDPRPTPAPIPAPDSIGTCVPAAFRGMRPRSDDRMTPPRIGFRWTWVPDSARTALPAGKVAFRVHLVSSDGAYEVTREVAESSAQLNLQDEFPTGKCQWWVEALLPGHPPIRSARETFLLEQ